MRVKLKNKNYEKLDKYQRSNIIKSDSIYHRRYMKELDLFIKHEHVDSQ